MDISNQYKYGLCLLVLWLLGTPLTFGLDLPDACNTAQQDVQTLDNSTTKFIEDTDSLKFKETLQVIIDSWAKVLETDTCAVGGCDLNSDELKVSVITTLMNGLTSKLITLSDRAAVQDLINTMKESPIIKTKNRLRLFCPQQFTNSPNKAAGASDNSSANTNLETAPDTSQETTQDTNSETQDQTSSNP